jgi:hypothetical protein
MQNDVRPVSEVKPEVILFLFCVQGQSKALKRQWLLM